MSNESFAVVGIRLIAVLFCGVGLLWLVGNILETAWDFNPNYLGYYFATQLLRPVLTLGLGTAFWFSSGKLAKAIAKE